MELANWSEVIVRSFHDLWFQTAQVLPMALVAILILVIGWIVGGTLGRLVAKIIASAKIDEALDKAGVREVVERSGYKFSAGGFLGGLVKWFIFGVFLIAALDVLKLYQVSLFLSDVVLRFLPQVIVAVLILLVASVLSEVVAAAVSGSARTANIKSAAFLGTMAKWAIWVFAFFVALNQLGVAQEFLQMLFAGLVAGLALAFGLAFGLGGRDTAAKLVADAYSSLTGKN